MWSRVLQIVLSLPAQGHFVTSTGPGHVLVPQTLFSRVDLWTEDKQTSDIIMLAVTVGFVPGGSLSPRRARVHPAQQHAPLTQLGWDEATDRVTAAAKLRGMWGGLAGEGET